MKIKNKTILMFILAFAAITFFYSHALAVDEWTGRGNPFYPDVCYSTSTTGDATDGWIICRFEDPDAGIEFPDINGEKATFNYAVVPGLGCDGDAGLCPTWSFFTLYVQNIIAENFLVTTDPKGATLVKDPITQCSFDPPSTGVKWNPKVNFQQFKKDPTNPVIFSITISMPVIASAECVVPYVVTSSDCFTGSLPGPRYDTSILQHTRIYSCTDQGQSGTDTIEITVIYDECSANPVHLTAENLSTTTERLEVNPIEGWFYTQEINGPEIRAFPVSRLGPYEGAIICSKDTDGSINDPKNNYPMFVQGSSAWYVERVIPPSPSP